MKLESGASEPERGLTENFAHTYVSSGSACVDFLFHVLPQTERDDAHRRLEAAWAEDPATALRLMMQLRAVRGTAKRGRAERKSLEERVAENRRQMVEESERAAVARKAAHARRAAAVAHAYESSERLRAVHNAVAAIFAAALKGDLETMREFEERRARKNAEGGGVQGEETMEEEEKKNELEKAKAEDKVTEETEAEGQGLKEEGVQEENKKEGESGGEGKKVQEKGSTGIRISGVGKKERSCAELVAEEWLDSDENDAMAWNEMVKRSSWQASRGDLMGRKEKQERGEEWVAKEKGKKDGENGGEAKKKHKWMGRPAPKLSLAAKWAPSLGKSFDQSTLLTSSIALLLSPLSSSSSSPSSSAPAADSGMDVDSGAAAGAGGYMRVAKERLQREVLAPLRRVLEVPEAHMSSGRWEHVAYGRVPSVCMNKTRKLFLSHDQARFTEYLADVKGGAAKIAAGALLPHEVVKAAMEAAEDSHDTVGELQWKAMVADVRSKGSLGNSMAVCDVPGSMSGTPMEVAIALSLLVSEVSSDPWKNHLITFSAKPMTHRVEGKTLVERVRSVQHMAWGYNTNFLAVFDLLLFCAQQFQLDPADMVQRLYVFSNMQFDEAGRASGADWETDHQEIVCKYAAAGYPVPQIVYWNLRGDSSQSSTPVAASEDGVALVSGFSKGMLLAAVLEGKEMSPMIVLEEAIKGKLFELIQVVD
ncbi:unnamed protein product [Closterium sp. Naga37s-1]|nr:unnamed protein product [Closterium sp. Naga37s-1]